MADSACHCNSLGLLQVRRELPRLPFVELLVVLCSIQERRRKTSVFYPDQFLQRRTIFSSENFGPADQNFQDQNSHDRPDSVLHSWENSDPTAVCTQQISIIDTWGDSAEMWISWSHRKPTEYTCSYEAIEPSSSPSGHLQIFGDFVACSSIHSNETEGRL